jgi:hypothetical protein
MDDLASANPQKLAELQALFLQKAGKAGALPMYDRVFQRPDPEAVGRPDLMGKRTALALADGMAGMLEGVFINVQNRSKTITAELEVPANGGNATILAQGGRFGGWSLYVKHGVPAYDYNFLGLQHTSVTSARKLTAGKSELRLQFECPRDAHAAWKAPKNRRGLSTRSWSQRKGVFPIFYRCGTDGWRARRSPSIAVRRSRWLETLASTPSTGIRVQCCGDAHLSNFGGFTTPERKILFSINDLDETLPVPWEWDVKRFAASFVVASRDNGLKDSVAKDVARNCVRTYRESMAEFSQLKTLELWYQGMLAEGLLAALKDPALRERALKRLQKERAKSIAEDLFPKLVEHKGELPSIKDRLPTIFHQKDVPRGEIHQAMRDALGVYRSSLPTASQSLLDRFELQDAAVNVVGIGSVGTSCLVLLFMAGEGDPLFLQVKEARASVLEPYAGKSVFSNRGQRVVHCYRMLQPASDMFLGWSAGPRRHFFVRQLRDIKISIRVETFGRAEMGLYATWCGRALALSRARSGSSAMLSGYMGKSGAFDKAVAAFSMAYADQNEKDHALLARAVEKGTLKAEFEGDRP